MQSTEWTKVAGRLLNDAVRQLSPLRPILSTVTARNPPLSVTSRSLPAIFRWALTEGPASGRPRGT